MRRELVPYVFKSWINTSNDSVMDLEELGFITKSFFCDIFKVVL